MKYYLNILLTGLISVFTFIQPALTQNLAVTGIPENLIRGANSVVRSNVTTFTIISENKMAIREATSITIINENALNLAHLKIFYNGREKVSIKTAAIYNGSGEKIRTIKQSEMSDYSTSGNSTLYSEARVIYCKIVPVSYPFTVVYDYEITYNMLYAFRIFSPYTSENQSVEASSLNIVNPLNIPLNIRFLNLPADVKASKINAIQSWNFSNLPPVTEEPLEPDFTEFFPVIRVAPEIIQYDRFIGTADSWENYGQWLSQLSEGRRNLSKETVSRLYEITSKTDSKKEKVRILYKYLQSRTHYINISLGIGGLQPHLASDVDELGYGDCKDLSNYMVAMLEAVGINSCYTVVKAGEGAYSFIKDQPGHQFNHAIVCVPNGNDSIWLECTSQINPFGYLGSFTDNRDVLIVKNDSSKLVRTREYSIEDNYCNSTININHGEYGTSAVGTITSSGLLMDEAVNYANQNQADQVDWVNKNLEMTDFSLISHSFKVYEDPKPSLILNVDLAINSFFTGNNGRLFAGLNINNRIAVPARVRNRKHPLFIPFSYKTSDTLVINLPDGYKPEQLPASEVNDERFGKYAMQSSLEGRTIICVRTFEVYKGHHPAELYQAFYEFMQKAAVADSKQLVLILE